MARIRWPLGGKNADLTSEAYVTSAGRQTERAIKVLATLGLVSLAAIILAGLVSGGGVHFIIWALIAALAATVVGGALGLLFGLPTSQVGPAPIVVLPPPPPATPPASGTPPGTPPPAGGQAATTAPGAQSGPTSAPISQGTSEQRELDIGYRDSTSLEQVADWLTKIIIGLTLTQYSSWEGRFETMARNLTEAMVGPVSRSADCLGAVAQLQGNARLTALASPICQVPPVSAIPGGVLLALAATIGFLTSYLWMRRYFILEMVVAKKAAKDLLDLKEAKAKSDVAAQAEEQMRRELAAAKSAEEKARTEAAAQKAELERSQAEASLQKAERERIEAKAAIDAEERAKLEEKLRAATESGLAPVATGAAMPKIFSVEELQAILAEGEKLLPPDAPGLQAVVTISRNFPTPAPDPEDPWRDKFGAQQGKDLILEATVKETSDPVMFAINLTVRASTEKRIKEIKGTKAIFYLHPIFGSVPRVSTFGADGRAPLEIYASRAFTVGVVVEDGTVLEVNLATLADAPDPFRSR